MTAIENPEIESLMEQVKQSGANVNPACISRLLVLLRQQTTAIFEAAKIENANLQQYAIGDVHTIRTIESDIQQMRLSQKRASPPLLKIV